MIIKTTSLYTGKKVAMELNVTPEQIARWEGGELIQNVMPHLNQDEREFLISGAMPGDFERLFPDDDEE